MGSLSVNTCICVCVCVYVHTRTCVRGGVKTGWGKRLGKLPSGSTCKHHSLKGMTVCGSWLWAVVNSCMRPLSHVHGIEGACLYTTTIYQHPLCSTCLLPIPKQEEQQAALHFPFWFHAMCDLTSYPYFWHSWFLRSHITWKKKSFWLVHDSSSK